MAKNKVFRAFVLLVLTAMLSIGFIACDMGNGGKNNSQKIAYKQLEEYLKNLDDSKDVNYIEINDVSNELLKGSADSSSCSPLGELIKNSNKKVFLILGKKANRATIDYSEIGEYAFYKVNNLVGIEFSSDLISIGKNAFAECPDLVTLDFSGCSKLKTIGVGAFSYLPKLKSIDFSGCTSLTKFEYNNFMWCGSLKNLDFSECINLTKFEHNNFLSCDSLTSLDLSSCTKLTEIGDYSFGSCIALKTVKLPRNLEFLGFASFAVCTSLTNIEVDKNNPNYSSENGILFNKDKSTIILYPIGRSDTSYDIPDSVMEIGENAFVACAQLTSIKFPTNLKKIKRWAFSGCSLTEVDLSACPKLESIEGGPFRCPTLTSIKVADDNPNYISENGILFNKDKTELVQYPNGKTQTSYKVPDSVTKIGDSAFSDCDKLTDIELPKNLIRLEDRAFSYSINLTSMKLPASLRSIGYAAFMSCRNLTNVDLSECSELESLEGQVFDYSINAVVKLPNADIQIDERSNFGSESRTSCVKEVQIPDNNAYNLRQRVIDSGYPENRITEYAGIPLVDTGSVDKPVAVAYSELETWLSNTATNGINYIKITGIPKDQMLGEWAEPSPLAEKLKTENKKLYVFLELEAKEALTEIPDQAFYKLSNLVGIDMPENLISIKTNAFYGCTKLEKIELPQTLKLISSAAFFGCTKLKSIKIPASITTIDYAVFSECIKLRNIDLSECINIKSIGKESFKGCYSLENIDLSAYTKLSSIKEQAFLGCTNARIKLPRADITIGSNAFGKSSTNFCLEVEVSKYNDLKNRVINSGYPEDRILVNTDVPNVDTGSIDNPVEVAYSELETWLSNTATNGINYIKITNIPIEALNGKGHCECGELGEILNKTEHKVFISLELEGGATLEKIPNNSLCYVYNIVGIKFPESLTTLEENAFLNCSKLESADISKCINLTKIERNVFGGSNIKSVKLPAKLKDIEPYYVFSDVLEEITVASDNPDFSSENGILFNKDKTTLILYPRCKSGTNYTVPASVQKLGIGAFDYCKLLTGIDFSECTNLSFIGVGAFGSCTALETLDFSSCTKIDTIKEWAFDDCTALKNIIISSNTFESEDGIVFNKDKTSLIRYPAGKIDSSYTVPKEVTDIEIGAFTDCIALSKVDLTKCTNLKGIGDNVFEDCKTLTTVDFSKSTNLEVIGSYTFSRCTSLTDVDLSNCTKLNKIWAYVFGYDTEAIIKLPNVNLSFDDEVFGSSENSWVKEVQIPSGNTTLKDAVRKTCGDSEDTYFPENRITEY